MLAAADSGAEAAEALGARLGDANLCEPATQALLAIGAGDAAHGAEVAHGTSWVDGLGPLAQTLVVLGAVAAIVVGGRYLLRPVFRVIAGTRMRELFTAAALLLILLILLVIGSMYLGFATATGSVVAAREWEGRPEVMAVPSPRADSLEAALLRSGRGDRLLITVRPVAASSAIVDPPVLTTTTSPSPTPGPADNDCSSFVRHTTSPRSASNAETTPLWPAA